MSEDRDIDGFFSTARMDARERVTLSADSYRKFLYDHDDPVLTEWRGLNYDEFARARREAAPFLRDLLDYWEGLYREPFLGITTDGQVEAGLYPLLENADASLDAPAVAAAEALLATLSDTQREAVRYPIKSPTWRAWSNPEFVVYRVGLRLEDLQSEQVDAVHALLHASLSEAGYERLHEVLDLNGFLGELTDLESIMNARSYWFALYGEPRVGGAWGWQLFGHHAAVNFITVRGRHVIAPVFLGGEPALTDDEHPPVFDHREQLALQLVGSLTPEQHVKAVQYASVLDEAMPEGRLHPADERHVAGAFRDNRVVPYEGIAAGELDARQQSLLREIVDDIYLLLRDDQRALTLAQFDEHLAETHFAWYGGTDGTEAFYFRIHSPVILAELDHHAGVWLSNRLPARFHVHTTLRHPNGNDYGKAYLAQLG